MDLGAQHGANIHQKSIKKSIKKLIEICIIFTDFLWILMARTFNFWWPSKLKQWFLKFMWTWILIDFWSIFRVILGPETYPKSITNQLKNQIKFDVKFQWILDGFWEGLGAHVGPHIHQKSIKNPIITHSNKYIKLYRRRPQTCFYQKSGCAIAIGP